DLDGLSLVGGVEAYSRYHHVLFHGYLGATITTAACLVFARQRLLVASLALTAFHLHLLCDLAGSGPGWPIYCFCPTSAREWFWTGQWNLASWQNSIIGLVATLVCFGCALIVRRTIVEAVSPRWDSQVTQAIRQRFLGDRALLTGK